MKVLIAEDNTFSRTLLEKTLVKAGYKPVVVENGTDAWEILQQDDSPKLALIDWMMPGFSGVELCRKIREIDGVIPTYVILLTAKAGREDVVEGFAAGADDFIKKPFDRGELLARIKVGRRLVEQQALMQCLIDSIPDPIYVKDSQGVYLGCNPAYAKFVGKRCDQIFAREGIEVLPSDQAQKSHEQDLQVMVSGKPMESDGWVTNADGLSVFHNTIKIPYLESSAGSTGMIGISRDLTRHVELEQELKRLAVVVEQSSEAIIITDVDTKILYVNAAFEQGSGYCWNDVIGETPSFLKSGTHNVQFFEELSKTISAGKSWSGEFTNRRKDGTLYVDESVIYPIRNELGEVINYVSISRDITKEMAIEKHLRQQQKMNAIGELAGGVSHDFNNILTAILGYVALCMNLVEEDSAVYGYLKEVVKAGDRAAQLVRQILTFSRQEEQEFQSLELQQIIEDSLGLVQTTMRKSIVVEKDIDPACGAILGDTTQLHQVILNLCTNAVHALGKEHSGTLSVALRQVDVFDDIFLDETLDLISGGYACVKVSDTGCGMPPDVVERIFEPYFTTKKKGEGTGFGLSIVHGVVRKHRGVIKVVSEEGQGTTFSLYFPLLKAPLGKKEVLGAPSVPCDQGKILFVDDDKAVLNMGRKILESMGYSVVTASSGEQAFDLFQQDVDGFDALVVDYAMPGMNGYELIQAVQKIRKKVPAILCSGYRERVKGENLNALDRATFMAKPIDWGELSRIIQQSIRL